MGSNAIAIGSAGTAGDHGLLLGNPHYPWHGARRFWQMQLTVPGRMNVSGVGLLGTPLVLIGHTAHVAWSHTVATPVTTPNTINTGNPGVRRVFGDAAAELRAAGIPLDAPLGKRQYVVRNGDRIPIHGGTEALGVLNKIEGVWNPPRGYTEGVTGSSYIRVVSFDGTRCPNTRTILTYSQSGNPNSPYYSDQTRMYSEKRWVIERFCEREIRHSPKLRVVRVEERGKPSKGGGKH